MFPPWKSCAGSIWKSGGRINLQCKLCVGVCELYVTSWQPTMTGKV
jgi:hypothetical protein